MRNSSMAELSEAIAQLDQLRLTMFRAGTRHETDALH
jgi:hypothetical protein